MNNKKKLEEDESVTSNNQFSIQKEEKAKLAMELSIANKALSFQNQQSEKRAAELVIANKELAFQNEEKEKRAAELVIANKELAFQNEKKEKRAAELVIANEELAFQNEEKEKRAAELTIAVNELKKSEDKTRKVSRLYAFSSKVNQHISQGKDGATFFESFFRIALELGKFKMAWIGMFDNENKKITLAGHGGISEEDIKLFTDIPFQTNGPQDHVLRTGTYYVCNDIAKDFELQNWKALAERYGILSCMALPIKQSGNIIGTFNLYAGELNFFDKEEIELLEELTNDISFALDILEKAKRQKITEELILKNENRFRALIEKSTDMKTLSTQEGEMIYCSPSITKVLGYTPEEFLHTSAFNFIHPDDIPGYREKRNAIIEVPGKSFTNRHRFLHKDGNWIWCEGTVTNMLAEPGINAFVSNFTDISEKKLIEKQREFDSNNLNALINNTNDLMWSVDREFKLITANKGFDESVRLMSGSIIGKGNSVFTEGFPPDQLNKYKKIYERAFAGEIFTELEHSNIPEEIWFEISYNPIRKGNEIIGVACHSRDITNIKRGEQQLSKSEIRLKEAQAIGHISNWEIDLTNNNITWSDELFNIFGIKKEEVEPSTELFFSFLHPDDAVTVRKTVQESLDTAKASSSIFRFIRKDGQTRYGYIERKFESDKNNKPVRLYGILQDITERMVGEMEREKMIVDMVQRNRDLEQFSFIISHNLRAPTANIIGFTESLLEETNTAEEQKESLHGLSSSVTRLDTVIKDINKILQVKREADENKEIICFTTLVNDIFISIGNLIDKHRVRIKTDFSEVDEICSLKGYIHSIFYNLISNSIKYRKPEEAPLIEISSKIENGKIMLIFKDNGLGMESKKQGDKVFGLYRRFHNHVEGKGMGLFMVKTQVEALGGKVSIESELNKGTTFKIKFDK